MRLPKEIIFSQKLEIYGMNIQKIFKSGYLEKFNYAVDYLYKEEKEIVILDLGGGYGDNFYKFIRFNQSKLKKIKYFIVDQDKKLLDYGKKIFAAR